MFKTGSHIIASFVLFVLTVGVSINKHYSNGKLYSLSVFGNAKSCYAEEIQLCTMQNITEKCEKHKKFEKENQQQASCSCEDTSEYIHFGAVYTFNKKVSIDKIYQDTTILIFSPAKENYSLILFSNKQLRIKNIGTLPDTVSDTNSLFQIFLC